VFLAFSFACVLFLIGCASMGNNFDEGKLSQIKKGETTETELIQMFGEPMHRSVNSDGLTTLVWMYAQTAVQGQSFIPIVGGFMGGANSSSKTLAVTLADNKVKDFTYSTGGSENRNMTQSTPKN
jgi:outer membrane protein assembly factor BamE (lipoprotein component of BamABCDE complex)